MLCLVLKHYLLLQQKSGSFVKDKCAGLAKVYCALALRRSIVLSTSPQVLRRAIVLASAHLHTHVIIHSLGCPFTVYPRYRCTALQAQGRILNVFKTMRKINILYSCANFSNHCLQYTCMYRVSTNERNAFERE